MRSIALPLLLALDLGLAGGLAALWLDEDLDPKNIAWREPAAISPAEDSMTVLQVDARPTELAQLTSTTERPLFWAVRRPPPPPKAESAAEPETDPFADIHLFGLVDGGESGAAIVRTGGRIRRVKVGESIGAWTLDGIVGREARFKGASGEVRGLLLKYAVQGARPVGADAPAATSAAQSGGTGVAMVRSADGSMKTVDEAIAERRARRDAARARAMAAAAAQKK